MDGFPEKSARDHRTYAEIIVPQRHVKRVKSVLEERNLLNKARKIAPHVQVSRTSGLPYMSIYTHLPLSPGTPEGITISTVHGERKGTNNVVEELDLEELKDEVHVAAYVDHEDGAEGKGNNLVITSLKKALETLPRELLISLDLSIETLVSSFPTSYTIYRPMLLLPHNSFTSPPWTKLLQTHPTHSRTLDSLWETLAAAVGTTHIATNAGIPLNTASSSRYLPTVGPQENILRSPTNLTPIYGSFGPALSAQTLSSPTPEDFTIALWVHHTQNSIHQTWAPQYTMFSRGNIREKTRLLKLPSVTSAPTCTAVDLYAGIGYFAFSYRKAGISKVLCWELNPWSIEGLRRGAALNGWRTKVVEEGLLSGEEYRDEYDFLIFPHENERALQDLAGVQNIAKIPPVRHVNCGFLPSSRDSWETAVKMLDEEVGGWVHAHENVGVHDVGGREVEVVAEMRGYLDGNGRGGGEREVRCEHVERVKTYAPGVLHVVFDIWVGGVGKRT